MGGLEYVLDELSLHQYKDIITAKTGFVFLNMRQSRPPLVYFVALLNVGWLALGFGVCADTHL